MQPTFFKLSEKKRWSFLLIASIFICLYSIFLCLITNPFVDNLTGLGYVHHRYFHMVFYIIIISLDSILLSALLFKKYPIINATHYQIGLICGWLLMCIGVLIPWQERTTSAQLDLHSLLCTAASIFMALLWLKLYTNPFAYGKLRKIIFYELLAIVCGVVWITLCGSITLMSEISYACLNILVLTFAQYPSKDK